MKRYLAPGLSVLLLSIGTAAWAATITVTSGTDPIDIDWQTATIDDLPGPDGKVSFSEAMIASNNTPGADVIAFALPPSEWQMQWLFPNRAVIYSSYTFFWRAYDAVTIDGTTQTEVTGDTNPDGAEVVLYGGEVYLNVDDCAYLGIDSGSVNINGSRSIARGNTGGINITYYGGSGVTIRETRSVWTPKGWPASAASSGSTAGRPPHPPSPTSGSAERVPARATWSPDIALNGITVGRNVEQTRISGNSIYENAALGIDLLSSAGRAVSPRTIRSTVMRWQRSPELPVITSASTNGAVVEVLGSTEQSFQRSPLEFFASPECDANGFGEGRSSSVPTTS
ncbi:MAG: hypothetical protein R3E12_20090 [Candidatus Eisenbacteria bacterium]